MLRKERYGDKTDMKKNLLLLFILALLLPLEISCGNKKTTDGSETPSPATSETMQEHSNPPIVPGGNGTAPVFEW